MESTTFSFSRVFRAIFYSLFAILSTAFLFLYGGAKPSTDNALAAGTCSYDAVLEVVGGGDPMDIEKGEALEFVSSIQNRSADCNTSDVGNNSKTYRKLEVDADGNGEYEYTSDWTSCYSTTCKTDRHPPRFTYSKAGQYTARTRITWRENPNGTVIEEDTVTINVKAPPVIIDPACNLNDPDGAGDKFILVNFQPFYQGGKKIFGNYGPADAVMGPVGVNVPSGVYKIEATSFDDHSQQTSDKVTSQQREQWVLRFQNGGGSVLAQTRATNDVPNNADQISHVLETGFVIPANVSKVDAYHAAYPGASTPESVTPVCALLENITPPEPTCSFNADPSQIVVGDSSTLSWSTTNAGNVVISNIGSVSANGNQNVTPATTTIYELTATGLGGEAICYATVTVEPLPDEPSCSNFTANPDSIYVGESTTLDWTQVNGVSASIDNGVGAVPLNGPKSVSPNQTTTYTLTITGAPGTTPDECEATVTVNPLPPLDCELNVIPNPVLEGSGAQVCWTLTGSPLDGNLISNDPGVFIPGPNNFTQDGCASNVGPFTIDPTNFTLSISDVFGQQASCNIAVEVNPPTPDKADVYIDKVVLSPQPPQGEIGDIFTYRLNFGNNGPDTAVNVRVIDVYDATRVSIVQFIGMSAGVSCQDIPNPPNGNPRIVCTAGDLSAGESRFVEYQAVAIAPGEAVNRARVATDTEDTNPDNNHDEERVFIDLPEAPTCTLSAEPNPVTAEQSIELCWTVIGGSGNGILDSEPDASIPGPNDFSQDGCVSPVGPIVQNTDFTLTVFDQFQQSGQCAVAVEVEEPQDIDVTVTKEANPISSFSEGTVTYTLTYQNLGTDPAMNVTLEDSIDLINSTGSASDFMITEQPTTGGVCVPKVTDDGIICVLNDLAANASGTITYTAKVSGNAGDVILNDVEISATNEPPANQGNNTDDAMVTIIESLEPDVSIMKEVNPAEVFPGDIVTYTLDYANVGLEVAYNVTVIDQVQNSSTGTIHTLEVQPPADGFCNVDEPNLKITCSLGTLNPGDTGTIVYTAIAGENLTNGNLLVDNLVVINTTSNDTNPVNDTDTARLTIKPPVPELELAKSVLNENSQETGDDVKADADDVLTYTLSASNSGTADVQDYVFIDDVNDILEYADIDSISDGGAENAGVITWPAMTIPFGQTVSVTFEVTVKAENDWPQSDFTLTNIFGNFVTVRLEQPDLAITINVDDTSVPPTIVGPPRVPTLLTYDLIWENLGNIDMEQTIVTVDCADDAINILSASGALSIDNVNNIIVWDLGTVLAGSSGPLTFEAELQDGYGELTPESFDCTAHIESAVIPVASETNQLNNDDDVTVVVDENNRDSIAKRVTNLSTGITSTAVQAQPGDEIEYVLSYTAGDVDMNGYVFNDDVTDVLELSNLVYNDPPANTSLFGGGVLNGNTITWDNGGAGFDVPAFQTQEVKFRIVIFDEETLSQHQGDFVLTNIFGNVTTTVTLPSLQKSKTVAINGGSEVIASNAEAGDILTYNLYVENIGAATHNAFVVEDDVSDILEYATVIDSGGGIIDTNAFGEQIISWPPADIAAGDTLVKTFQVQILNPLPQGGDFTLRNAYGNSVTVVTIPDLNISKSVLNTDTQEQGTNVNADENHVLVYTLTANNTGSADFLNFVFSDDVNDILEYAVLGSISDGGAEAGGAITWPAMDVPNGQSVSVTFEVTVNATANWPANSDFRMENIFGNTVVVELPGVVEVDTHIEKTVDTVVAIPGQVLTYTLTYFNEGNDIATNVTIEDDIDESKLDIDLNSLPANCAYVDLGDPLKINGGPMGIRCSSIDLEKTTPAQVITYMATVKDDATGDIINTAEINQDEVDIDPSDNQSSATVPVETDVNLSIVKIANPVSLVTGQQTQYAITVTNDSSIAQSFTVTDVLGAGNNGGSLTFLPSTVSFVFSAGGSASGNSPFIITDLEGSGNTVTITYNATASNSGIPTNQSSLFTNIATIVETGDTATEDVFVVGPRSGGSGGGGGGGGSRIIRGSLNVFLQKEVFDTNIDTWKDADTVDLAAFVDPGSQQEIRYRILVRNEGSIKGDITVEDIFSSQSLNRVDVQNVTGATWDPHTQEFLVEDVGAGSTKTIAYTAVVSRLAGTSNPVAVNTATVTEAELSSDLPSNRYILQSVEGIGTSDDAYVKTFGGDVELKKRVDKIIANRGEEIRYTLTVRNVGSENFTNVRLVDEFPYEFVDIISMSPEGVRQGNALVFTKSSLAPSKLWIVRITARIKDDVKSGTVIPNLVNVEADGQDFSDKWVRVKTLVDFPKAPRTPDVGPAGIFFGLFLFSTSLLYIRLRKRGILKI